MSTSGRKNLAALRQGPHDHRQHNEAQGWEDTIMVEVGVSAKVTIRDDQIHIKTKDARDYFLARSVVAKRSGLPICQAK